MVISEWRTYRQLPVLATKIAACTRWSNTKISVIPRYSTEQWILLYLNAGINKIRTRVGRIAISSAEVVRCYSRLKALPVMGAVRRWLFLTGKVWLHISVLDSTGALDPSETAVESQHWESSSDSHDERMLSTVRPTDTLSKPTNLAMNLPHICCCHPFPLSPFVNITLPDRWYSFYRSAESSRLTWPTVRHYRCECAARIHSSLYHRSCRDRQNCTQWDLISKSRSHCEHASFRLDRSICD